MSDSVNSPAHYNWFSNGAEIIDITENLSFNLGNVVKYVGRAGRKTLDPFEDLRKAQFYLAREIGRLVYEAEQEAEADYLPDDLYLCEDVVWTDDDGDEWRWIDSEGWAYRTPEVTGWIEIFGAPAPDYGPYKEKHE